VQQQIDLVDQHDAAHVPHRRAGRRDRADVEQQVTEPAQIGTETVGQCPQRHGDVPPGEDGLVALEAVGETRVGRQQLSQESPDLLAALAVTDGSQAPNGTSVTSSSNRLEIR
jgi:hypothetical protein